MQNLLKNNPDKYIQLFADCIPVRGATKSAIYDLTRKELTSFPTPYYDLLKQFEGKKNSGLTKQINQSTEKEAIHDLIEFLFEFEFAFMASDPARFPKIAPGWEVPQIINNAIIDIDQKKHDMGKILHELDQLGCQFLQIRSFSTILELDDLYKIVEESLHKSIQGIELILKFDPTITDNDFQNFMAENPIISSLTFHSSDKERALKVATEEENPFSQKTIYFTEKPVSSESHCGVINLNTLSSPSVSVFFENLEFNGCLNRKISVDKFGNIKNCPSMATSYGNVMLDSLDVAINDSAFKEYWTINKDQIDTCRDCELRYICSDCRVYTESDLKNNAKPLKCNYNPYSGEWEE